MDAPQMYVEELRKLYDCRKIGVRKDREKFCCDHFACCKAAAKAKGRDLVKGAEAHVGEKYGDPIRLVFISLDTGGDPKKEFGECLLKRRKIIQSVTYDDPETNPHMKGTIETLSHLYGRDKREDACDLLKRFAMTNSAKCSGKDKEKDRVPDKLYKNCREHGLAELGVLKPQLVVAQGSRARDLLKRRCIDEQKIQKHVDRLMWKDVDVRPWICTQVKEYLKYWESGDQLVPVLQCPHPSARQGQWQRFERTMLPTLAHFLRQWFPDLDDFFRSCKK